MSRSRKQRSPFFANVTPPVVCRDRSPDCPIHGSPAAVGLVAVIDPLLPLHAAPDERLLSRFSGHPCLRGGRHVGSTQLDEAARDVGHVSVNLTLPRAGT